MSDTFRYDVDNIKKIINQITKDLTARIELKRTNKFTALKDQEIKGSINKLDSEFKLFSDFVQRMEKNPNSYKITIKEAERRKNIQFELFNQIAELKEKIQQSMTDQTANNKKDFEMVQQKQLKIQTDIENSTNTQLIQMQQENKQKQDLQLDSLIDVIQNVKHVAKGIGQELVEQEELLDDMDQGFDKNTKVMQKLRHKMTRIMYETSNCGLIIFIILQIILMFFMLFYL